MGQFDALDAAALCPRCGLKVARHLNAGECINALRDHIATVEMRDAAETKTASAGGTG
jgi:hypothetical protein